MPQLPKAAHQLVRDAEGLRLTAYQDAGGVWTCGYGSTGPDIGMRTRFTPEEAEARLEKDLQAAARSVDQMVSVPLTANQRGALSSFIYNLGAGTFRKSTLRVLLNRGDFGNAALEFAKWTYCNHRILPGLVTRRAAEAALFRQADAGA